MMLISHFQLLHSRYSSITRRSHQATGCKSMMLYYTVQHVGFLLILYINSASPFGLLETQVCRGGITKIPVHHEHQDDPFEEQEFQPDDPMTFHSFLPDDHPVGKLYQRKQQLWIDLRETSLFPHEANTFLMDQLFSDEPAINGDLERIMKDPVTSAKPLFDGALVSESMLQSIIENRSSGSSNAPYILLYTPVEGNQLLIDESLSQKSYVIGRTIICDRNNRLDPLSAVETVVAKQNWLLVDYRDRGATAINQVLDVLQLLSSNAASMSLEDLLRNEKSPSQSEFGLKGGIAVTCNDVNSFMTLDSKITEMQTFASMRGTSTTKSGLIVPNVIDSQAADDSLSSVPTMALILPLDLALWNTANEIRNLIDR